MAQHYAPEEVSGAVLATELAEDLAVRGHAVSFVTSAPSYPYGRVYDGYSNELLSRETKNGVHLVRVWSWISPVKSFWRRILNYGTFSLLALAGGLAAGKTDVLMSVSPPLPLGITAWLVSRIRNVPWLLRVEDLYPDAAVAAGVLRNSLAIRFFRWLEEFLYQRADHISVISESFRQNLMGKGVPPAKLSVLPVWADPDFVQPMEKENEFRRANGLCGKFVLLYSGNLGYNSALEDVIEAAHVLLDRQDIAFVIVGEGVKKPALQALAQAHGLSNVSFLPYQPRAAYSEILAAADLSLVTMSQAATHTSLPSKIFNIMASARPILAVVHENSEIASLIGNGPVGVVVSPAQPVELAKKILALKENPEQLGKWGIQGRRLLQQQYSRERCIDIYERTLENTRRAFVLGTESQEVHR
jgi:colanic acid biosynthesis glycosyl transferase WcaI